MRLPYTNRYKGCRVKEVANHNDIKECVGSFTHY